MRRQFQETLLAVPKHPSLNSAHTLLTLRVLTCTARTHHGFMNLPGLGPNAKGKRLAESHCLEISPFLHRKSTWSCGEGVIPKLCRAGLILLLLFPHVNEQRDAEEPNQGKEGLPTYSFSHRLCTAFVGFYFQLVPQSSPGETAESWEGSTAWAHPAPLLKQCSSSDRALLHLQKKRAAIRKRLLFSCIDSSWEMDFPHCWMTQREIKGTRRDVVRVRRGAGGAKPG